VEEEGRFPYRFFVVTFAWSWLMWLPLVLAGAGIIRLGRDLLSAVTVPWIALGVFGPAAGAGPRPIPVRALRAAVRFPPCRGPYARAPTQPRSWSSTSTIDLYSGLFDDDLDGVAERLDAGARVLDVD